MASQDAQRVIKFRVWDPVHSKMSKRPITLGQPFVDFEGYTVQLAEYEGLRFTYLQCTGLHDKNGKEIYEGDIVRCRLMRGDNHTHDYEVRFEDAMFRVEGNPLSLFDEHEVIGNIYEHSYLIGKYPDSFTREEEAETDERV